MCGSDPEYYTTAGPARNEDDILPFGSADEQRQSRSLPVSLLFTRSSWRFSSRFPLNEPPAGCLNRPLINPSVGSLLRPQPSEEGSNPAKQTEGRLSSWSARRDRNPRDFLFEFFFYFINHA